MEPKKNYYFMEPEFDFHYRLLRLMIILNKNSFTSKGKKVLILEKIMIFDFLIANPKIFKEILEFYNIELQLKFSEKDTIENYSYLNFLTMDKEYRSLLNILVNKYIDYEIIDKKVYYSITEIGKEFVLGFENSKFERLNELTDKLDKIKSKNISELKNLLKQ